MHRITITTQAVALGGLLTLTVAGAAAAVGRAGDVYTVGGGGIATVDADGSAVLTDGPALVSDRHLRDQLDATLDVVLAAADGSLPAPDTCEPASATFVVEGERDADMTLVGSGEVCAVRNPFAPSFVSQEFNGQHVVTDAKRPGLEGDHGSFRVTVTSGGFTSAYATSFVPTA